MPIIYRVENSEARGPYTGIGDMSLWTDSNHTDAAHPCPNDDSMPWDWNFNHERISDARCGFESLKALTAWFNPQELTKLKELGYRIRAYQVPEDAVIRGKKQIVFDWSRSIRLFNSGVLGYARNP